MKYDQARHDECLSGSDKSGTVCICERRDGLGASVGSAARRGSMILRAWWFVILIGVGTAGFDGTLVSQTAPNVPCLGGPLRRWRAPCLDACSWWP